MSGDQRGNKGGGKKVLRIDVTTCRYESVRASAKELGWKILDRNSKSITSFRDESASGAGGGAERGPAGRFDSGGGSRMAEGQYGVMAPPEDYNLYWTDKSLTRTRFKRMLPHQMANHFPDMHELCCKSFLSFNLESMKRLHPSHYDFSPESWVLPEGHKEFLRECRRPKKDGEVGLFIVKPERGCQGKGIFLTKTGEEEVIQESLWNLGQLLVAQRYINNSLLIDGIKFDLRLYVLVTCCDPLRVYMAQDGLARFCTEKFDPLAMVDGSKLPEGWAYTHLTNSSLNKFNKAKFKDSTDERDGNLGSKRRISGVLELLKRQGRDVDGLWEQLEDIVVKALISAQPLLAHNHRLCQPQDKVGDRCFEILGADVLLDDTMKPWLLELNHSPSYHCESMVDTGIKRPLLEEAMRIVRHTLERRAGLPLERRAGLPSALPAHHSSTPLGLLFDMQGSVAAGVGVQEADPAAATQDAWDFDQDRPRYNPPGAERMQWRGRTPEEEEEWLAEQERGEREAGMSLFRLCYPPPKGSEREAVYEELLESAQGIHARRTAPRKGTTASEGGSSGEEGVALSSSAASEAGDESDEDDDARKGEPVREAEEEEEGGKLSRWEGRVVQWSGALFGAGVFCPPLMVVMLLVFRGLRKRDYEAGMWATLSVYVLCVQLPLCLLLGYLVFRMETLMHDIQSGKHAVPMEDYMGQSEGGEMLHGESHAQGGGGGGAVCTTVGGLGIPTPINATPGEFPLLCGVHAISRASSRP